jgi:hypothetical protein
MHPQADRGDIWLIKSTGGLGQLKVRGLEKARTAFILALAAYDLIRLPRLLQVPS